MRIGKFFSIIAVLLIVTFYASGAKAQVEATDTVAGKQNIIQRIAEESNGNVEFVISDELTEKILTPPEVHKKHSGQTQVIRPGVNKVQGYRIQVFSDGRNQHSLEARAKARGNAILAKFPKYRGQVYTFSSSPNWYTRVGNFRNASEAEAALADLKRAFPSFAQEMRVVKCQIVVIR